MPYIKSFGNMKGRSDGCLPREIFAYEVGFCDEFIEYYEYYCEDSQKMMLDYRILAINQIYGNFGDKNLVIEVVDLMKHGDTYDGAGDDKNAYEFEDINKRVLLIRRF